MENNIFANWNATGLLYSLDETVARNCALSLECQRLFNESGNSDYLTFRRISIPLIRRIYGYLWNLEGTTEPEREYVSSLSVSMVLDSDPAKEYETIQALTEALCDEISDCLHNGEFTKLGSISIQDNKFVLAVS